MKSLTEEYQDFHVTPSSHDIRRTSHVMFCCSAVH